MALREIVITGHPVLRKKAKKVEKITPLDLQLMDDMAETMYNAPGVGLAAPQVGVSKRIVVVDVGDGLFKLVNPKIIYSEGSEIDAEGCLSVPGLIGDVERYTKITVKATTPDGKTIKIDAENFFARCLQHELDHLDGVLYTDKASNMREPEPFDEEEEIDDEEEDETEESESESLIEKEENIP